MLNEKDHRKAAECAALTADLEILWKKDISLTEHNSWDDKDTEAVVREKGDNGLLHSIAEELEDSKDEDTAVCIYRAAVRWMGGTDKELNDEIRGEIDIENNTYEKKSHIPIIINKILVTAAYNISSDEKDISVLREMQTIAAVTFSAIDISMAGIKAAGKGREGFVDNYIGRINFPGIGDLVLSSSDDARRSLARLYDEYEKLMNGEEGVSYIDQVMKVYENLADAVLKYDIPMEKRLFVEMKSRDEVSILKENRGPIESYITGYMKDRSSEK